MKFTPHPGFAELCHAQREYQQRESYMSIVEIPTTQEFSHGPPRPPCQDMDATISKHQHQTLNGDICNTEDTCTAGDTCNTGDICNAETDRVCDRPIAGDANTSKKSGT